MSTTRRPKEDLNFWNVWFSVFFILVLAGALWSFWSQYRAFPTQIPPFDALLLAFASFRITRLMVYDKITRFFREWFMAKKEVSHEDASWIELTPIGRGFRHTMSDLLNCPWCIGLWAGLITTYCYFMFPWAWFVVLFLAVSGAGSFIQIAANRVGWQAENLKQDALAKEKEGHYSDRSGI